MKMSLRKKLEKLKHASSRRVIYNSKNKTVVKFYPAFYGYVLHDVVRIIFYVMNGVYFASFTLPKKRIDNEIKAREILAEAGVRTTRIRRFSKKEKFLEEYFVGDAYTLDDLEKIDCKKAIRFANKIGRITRKLNDSGHYFIDNRASNWLVNRDLIRTDLEFFVSKKKNRKFSMFCDVLSFVSSVENEEVASSFMKGYGKKIKPPFLFELFANLYIKITDVIF